MLRPAHELGDRANTAIGRPFVNSFGIHPGSLREGYRRLALKKEGRARQLF